MHLIDKDPMPKKPTPLTKALNSKTGASNYTTNPLLHKVPYKKTKPREVMIEARPAPKKKDYKIPATPKVSGEGWGY